MLNSVSALAYSQISAAAAASPAMKGDVIDLNGSWSRFWNSITSAANIDRLMTLLSIVGVIIVAAAIVKWSWDRRRGVHAGNSGAVWGSLLVGAVLSAPNLLIPIVLQIFDILVNSIAKIWSATS